MPTELGDHARLVRPAGGDGAAAGTPGRSSCTAGAPPGRSPCGPCRCCTASASPRWWSATATMPAPRRSAGGRYHLGDAEWQDVESALLVAAERGAAEVVLFGWSMGGAIVLQLVARSWAADRVRAVVLDAPVLDWRHVLGHHARLNGVPDPVGRLAQAVLQHRAARRLLGVDAPLSLDRLDWVSRAAELRVPLLIIPQRRRRVRPGRAVPAARRRRAPTSSRTSRAPAPGTRRSGTSTPRAGTAPSPGSCSNSDPSRDDQGIPRDQGISRGSRSRVRRPAENCPVGGDDGLRRPGRPPGHDPPVAADEGGPRRENRHDQHHPPAPGHHLDLRSRPRRPRRGGARHPAASRRLRCSRCRRRRRHPRRVPHLPLGERRGAGRLPPVPAEQPADGDAVDGAPALRLPALRAHGLRARPACPPALAASSRARGSCSASSAAACRACS